MEDIQGTFLKGYQLEDRIGSGGFGAVYRARQTTLGREVAVKIILPGYANNPEFIRRFETEANLIARLEHPYITPLHDFWRDPSGAYLIMRFLRGGSVRQSLQNGPYELDAASRLLDQIASALDFAHRHEVIHRDIKPGNILLDEDGNAYLADFGIAKDLAGFNDQKTAVDAVVGSLDYISPEQARSEPVTARTDIYSLGITLYELITGEHPFKEASTVERLYKHINDRLPDINTLSNGRQDAINDVIQKATTKDPELRYEDALAMAIAFREAIGLTAAGQAAGIVEQLTMREQEILAMIVQGMSNREIADALVVTVGTVKWHITQLYKKLCVRSRVQAIVRARELNLIAGGRSAILAGEEGPRTAVSLPEPENPYKGLHAFQVTDSRSFFGRDELVKKITDRLSEDDPYNRFLAIIGPSGSGKSSLVRAGLIASLWRGAIPGSEKWFVVDMVPGTHPLDKLETALIRVSANQAANLREQLQRDERGLLRVADIILPGDDTELVIVVDQFEEVFTLVEDEETRQRFLDLLRTAVSDVRSRVRVVVTLRADYYDRPLHYSEFGELLRARMETVLPLSAKGLERAVRGPAEQVGVTFEQGLVEQIVSTMNYQAGALPLLQYALTELFDRREGRLLTQEAFQEIGGAVGALANRAEEIYSGLTPEGQELARQMFLRLVTLGEGTEDARRRATMAELLSLTGNDDLMEEVIEQFAAYRLLSLDHDPQTRQPTVEVAHEAILREWERLRGWLNASREDIRQERAVGRAAEEWAAGEEDASYLLRGARLEQVEKWAATTELTLTPLEKEFIAESLLQREQEEEAETVRVQHEALLEQRSRNRLRSLVVVLAAATLVSGALGLFAFQQRQDAIDSAGEALANLNLASTRESQALIAADARATALADAETSAALSVAAAATADAAAMAEAQAAEEARVAQQAAEEEAQQRSAAEAQAIVERQVAEEQASLARSRELAAQAIGQLQSNQELAILLAIQALTINDSFEARNALHAAVLGSRLRGHLTAHRAGIAGIAYSPDGELMATTSVDGSAKVWRVNDNELLFETPINILTGEVDFPVSFSPDGTRLITLDPGEAFNLGVWDTGTWQRLETIVLPITTVNMARYAFNSDLSQVAVGYENGKASSWDLESREQLADLPGYDGWVEPYYSPDGTLLATYNSYSDVGKVIIWNPATGTSTKQINLDRGISIVAVSPDNRWLAVTSEDEILLWDLNELTGENEPPDAVLRGHGIGIFGLAFTKDSRQLASGGRDQTVRIWDVLSGRELYKLGTDATINNVVFTPDGNHLVAGDDRNALRFWDLTAAGASELFALATGDFSYGELSPDGNLLATGQFDGVAKLWNLETGQEEQVFEGHDDRIMVVDFHPHEQQIATASMDGSARVWDLVTGQDLLRMEGHEVNSDFFRGVLGLAYSPDGRMIATSGADGKIRTWDAATGEALLLLDEWENWATWVAFSPDGSMLASGGELSDITIWDPQSGQELISFPAAFPDRDIIWRIEFSPDGHLLAVSGTSGVVKIWAIDKENARSQLLATLTGHTGIVRGGLDFSSDGHFLATSADDGTRLWDLSKLDEAAPGEPVPTSLIVPGVNPLFNPDGDQLVTGDGGSLLGFTLDNDRLLQLGESRVTRGFTAEECDRFNIEPCAEENDDA